MKLQLRESILFIVIIFLFSGFNAESQVVVEKSSEKVVISGKQYFIHIVKKGQTLYSISKAYGISESEITKENPSVLNGIKENQNLKIPVITPTVQAVPRDETKNIYHKIGSGETIYSLSKKYGVTAGDIIESNPNIDIYTLSLGAEIAVPRKQPVAVPVNSGPQESNYFMYKVGKGETLSSISRKFGVTVKDLRQANNSLVFPRVDEYIRIPGTDKTIVVAEPQPQVVETVTPVVEEILVIDTLPFDFTSVKNLSGTVNVSILLPFYLNENSGRIEIDSSQTVRGRKVYRSIIRPETWIYGSSINFIEMYQGILLAVDTLRSLGLNVNLSAYDIRNDSISLKNLISSGKLRDMDLIIGPVYSNNLAIMANYAKRYGIPVVSPVPLKNNSVLTGNPDLYIVNPSLKAAQDRLAEKISEYGNYNLVFIHADSARTDPDVSYFKEAIYRELKLRIPAEQIRFKEFVFYSRSAFDSDSVNRLGNALSAGGRNLAIIASEDPPVMDETITNLDALSKQFDISIIGYPALRGLKNTDPKYFFDNGIMLYSPFWIDMNKSNVKEFLMKYRKNFFTEPGVESFAWQGYDLAYYFMSGIALNKMNGSINRFTNHNPELLQTSYEFRQKSRYDGFENVNFFLIKYTPEMEVGIIDETDPQSDAGKE